MLRSVNELKGLWDLKEHFFKNIENLSLIVVGSHSGGRRS